MIGMKMNLLKTTKKHSVKIKALVPLLLAFIVVFNTMAFHVLEVKASAVAIDPTLTIGQMLYGLFSASGATPVLAPGFMEKDKLFSSEAEIQNLIASGKVTKENGEVLKNLYELENMSTSEKLKANFDGVMDWIQAKADSGESDFAKNMVVPVTVTYEKIATGLPGPTPSPSPAPPSVLEKGKKWLGQRIAIGLLAGSVWFGGGDIVPNVPTVNEVLQEWTQPQIEKSVSSDIATSENIDFLNTPIDTTFSSKSMVVYDSYNGILYNYFYPSDSFAFFNVYRNRLNFLSKSGSNKVIYNYKTIKGPAKYAYNRVTEIYYSEPVLFDGYYLGSTGFSDGAVNNGKETFFYGVPYFYDWREAVAYCNTIPDIDNYKYNNYSPSFVNQNGNIKNTNDIQPIINNNQSYSYPTINNIKNYNDNYYNIINNNNINDPNIQQQIADNWHDFTDGLINSYVPDIDITNPDKPPIDPNPDKPPVDPTPPVEPPVTPPVDPEITPTPGAPSEEHGNWLFPNLEKYFPFCIPWDVFYIFKKFEAPPVAPVIEFPIKSQLYDVDETIILDCNKYNEQAELLRRLQLILFCVGLLVKTKRMIF